MSMNHQNEDGNNPMHLCYSSKFQFYFTTLFNYGCDFSQTNNNNDSPIILMLKNDEKDSFNNFLIQNLLYVQINIEYFLKTCIEHTSYKCLQCILSEN